MRDSRGAAAATEGSAAVGGVHLYLRSVGEGLPVIVLHGGPGAHHDYLLPQFDALAVGRRLWYYDQRGGGQSPVPRETAVGWREHVADLRDLVEHLGIANVTLVGYSWGGLLALLYAIRHPDRIGRLALVSAAAATAQGRSTFEQRLAERMADPRIVEEREALHRSNLRDHDPEAYRQRLFEISVAGYFKDPARARNLTPFLVTDWVQRAVWESLGDYDLTADLAALAIPTLMVHGRHDPNPLSGAEETAHLLNARLAIFEESGHVPYVEEFDRFVSVLDDFLPSEPG